MTEEGLIISTEARGRMRAGGVYLRNLRESQEITRAELAEQLLSVSEALVSDIEAGSVRLSIEDMSRWALALGVRHDMMADALGRLYDPLPFDTFWTRAAA
ncbi:helix-turn-helix domain-containing protein [Roseospira visakhapatnamensis]|uniref:Transcriptional regulator with XRE-family HTH domain n=1 Tax=Roseospira visakhapatnamensis TaxID=390880 RepID=A0A7W6RB39_9PROT|nr:helix-turn-helix transcriptional regulator [Roseospira visakhapatnamensis]MBB4264659.1 transcriptional regulator with XRE-family HTH domain [Roseospira visakhapatnamensis]